MTLIVLFQFTHPGGVRPPPSASSTSRHDGFNSRTREGCDLPSLTSRLSVVFQFTHPGGVRRVLILAEQLERRVSIHAPGRGATSVYVHDSIYLTEFQFTHPGGVRLAYGHGKDLAKWFQFTHPGGVRLSAI